MVIDSYQHTSAMMKERGYTTPHRIQSARQGRASTGATMRRNDAALAEREDIDEVNMDDRLIGKLQSDVEYIKTDVGQIKSDIREMKRDIGELKAGQDALRSYIDLSLEKMRGSNRVAFIAIIVLLVLTLMSSAPGAVATLLKLL